MNNEWEKEFEDWIQLHDSFLGGLDSSQIEPLKSFITSLLASERADWLRSEIEKLKNMLKKEDLSDTKWQAWGGEQIRTERLKRMMYNQALTSIITRYKEELLELEKGI